MNKLRELKIPPDKRKYISNKQTYKNSKKKKTTDSKVG